MLWGVWRAGEEGGDWGRNSHRHYLEHPPPYCQNWNRNVQYLNCQKNDIFLWGLYAWERQEHPPSPSWTPTTQLSKMLWWWRDLSFLRSHWSVWRNHDYYLVHINYQNMSRSCIDGKRFWYKGIFFFLVCFSVCFHAISTIIIFSMHIVRIGPSYAYEFGAVAW